MIRTLLIALFALATFPVCGQDDDAVFESANNDFEKGDYESAALKYTGLAEKGLISPELFYNLGTALYRDDKPGEAMLWFRRSLVARPGMAEAAQNIKFLSERIGFLEFAESKVDTVLRSLPPTFGKWLFTVALWIGLISLSAAFCVSQLRPNRSGLVTLSVIAFLFAIVGNRITNYSATHLALQNFATIVGEKVSAVTSPTPDAESVIDLPPGSEVRILQVAGQWIYAAIPGDLRGWIRRDDLEQVWPIIQKTS